MDRRRSARIANPQRREGPSPSTAAVTVRDISAKGMFAESHPLFSGMPVGTAVMVSFDFQPLDTLPELNVRARVVRKTAQGVGLAFQRLDPRTAREIKTLFGRYDSTVTISGPVPGALRRAYR